MANPEKSTASIATNTSGSISLTSENKGSANSKVVFNMIAAKRISDVFMGTSFKVNSSLHFLPMSGSSFKSATST